MLLVIIIWGGTCYASTKSTAGMSVMATGYVYLCIAFFIQGGATVLQFDIQRSLSRGNATDNTEEGQIKTVPAPEQAGKSKPVGDLSTQKKNPSAPNV